MGPRSSVYVEIRGPGRLEPFPLAGARCTIGKSSDNDIPIAWDSTASHVHAALEPYGATWCVKDLGSTNGTFVNGDRIWSDRALRDRDTITIGKTEIVFRAPGMEPRTATVAPSPPPYVTRREREVLAALCRPSFKGDYFTEPASVKAIAQELYVSEAAVKQHLSRLYEKFEIREGQGERRIRLANDAIRRGAVTLDDLRSKPTARVDPDDGTE